ATPVVTRSAQVRAVVDGLQRYTTLVPDLGVVVAALAILLSMHAGPWRIRDGPALAFLAPALAAFGLYALVLVEARYIAPFLVLLLLGLFMLVRLPSKPWSGALAKTVSAIMVLVLVLKIGSTMSEPAASLLSQIQ